MGDIEISSGGSDLGRNQQSCSLDALACKFSACTDIESLFLEDVRIQKKSAAQLRRTQREQRRRLVQESVRKMKAAANSRFGSALLGVGLKIGAAAFECLFADPIGAALGEKASKAINRGVSAVADGLSSYNPMEMQATDQDGQAKRLQDAADAQRDASSDTGEWLASARELERRALQHLENIMSTRYQTRLTAMGG